MVTVAIEIKRRLLFGRKAMSNLDSMLKSGNLNKGPSEKKKTKTKRKVHLVKAMFFPVVVCACESWTVKKAGRLRKDAF